MRDFRIYLAGAMTGLSWDEQYNWRQNVKRLLLEVNENLNLEVINPCDFYNFKDPSHDSELEIMKYDLRLVKQSDLIIVNLQKGKDFTSIGTSMELIVAYENNIPILGICENKEELHPWVLNCCDKIFNDWVYLLHYTRDFYLR